MSAETMLLFAGNKQAFPFSIDRVRGGSGVELFTLTDGVNEHDVLFENGQYLLFYQDPSGVLLRQSPTLAGLGSATPSGVLANILYPTVIHEGATWHIWGKNVGSAIEHYTAAAAAGPYTLADTLDGTNRDDVYARRSPLDGKIYMIYYNRTTLQAEIMSADAPEGPWSAGATVFDAGQLAPWYRTAQYDVSITFVGAKVFAMFVGTGADGAPGNHYGGVVELTPATMKALGFATAILPQANVMGDPTFITPDKISRNFINGSAAKAFGYVQLQTPAARSWAASDIVRLRMLDGLDLSNNILATRHGTAAWSADGLVCDASPGGAYGWPNIQNLVNFDITVEFTPAGNHADYGTLFAISRNSRNSQPYMRMNFYGNQLSLQIAGDTGAAIAWFSTATTYARHTFRVTKVGTTITAYRDGVQFNTGSLADGNMTAITEWSAGNWLGFSQTAARQFNGTIHSIAMATA